MELLSGRSVGRLPNIIEHIVGIEFGCYYNEHEKVSLKVFNHSSDFLSI